MSSRVLRGETQAPEPIVWRRPANITPAAQSRKQEAAASAGPEDAGISVKEMEARASAAHQQGYSAGEAAGAARANSRLEPVLAALTSIVSELTGARQRFRVEAEEATVALAIAIARRVLHRELATDPEAILGLVKAAFQKCDAKETHRLILSPADADCVKEYRGRLRFPATLDIVADGGLQRGSAVFETTRGELDVSVETQLAEIERGFADVLKRRHS